MRRVCEVSVNGQSFPAACGDLLLDAAIAGGVDLPHDCRSGYCGTCRVNVVDGRFYGGNDQDGTVRACQCRVLSDLTIAVEDGPTVSTTSGHVVELVPRAPDVVEIAVDCDEVVQHRPGQYLNLKFRGFPARSFSPTPALHPDAEEPQLLRFHIRIVPNGRVTSALGRSIRVGHRVKILGPLGSAYFRPQHANRTILVAGGTGFAPIWAIARASLAEKPDRELVVVVGARDLNSLYMIPALCELARHENVSVIPVVNEPKQFQGILRAGFPTHHIPEFVSSDMIYVCGAPGLVNEISARARAANARCYSDPFEYSAGPSDPLITRLRSLFDAPLMKLREA